MSDNEMNYDDSWAARSETWLVDLENYLVAGKWDYARGAFRHCLKSTDKDLTQLGEIVKEHMLEISDDGYLSTLESFLKTWRPLLEEPDAYTPMLYAIGAGVRQQMSGGHTEALKVTLTALESYPENFKANILVAPIGDSIRKMAPALDPNLGPVLDVLRDFPDYHSQAVSFAKSENVFITPLDVPNEAKSHIVIAFREAGLFFKRLEPRVSVFGHVNKSVNQILRIWDVGDRTYPKKNPPSAGRYGAPLWQAMREVMLDAPALHPSHPDCGKVRKAAERALEYIERWLRNRTPRPS